MGITSIGPLYAETIKWEDSVEIPGVVTPLSHTHWGSRWIRVADPDGRVHPLEEVL